jgi:hypothetical protein
LMYSDRTDRRCGMSCKRRTRGRAQTAVGRSTGSGAVRRSHENGVRWRGAAE